MGSSFLQGLCRVLVQRAQSCCPVHRWGQLVLLPGCRAELAIIGSDIQAGSGERTLTPPPRPLPPLPPPPAALHCRCAVLTCALSLSQEVIGTAIALLLLSKGAIPLWGGVLLSAVSGGRAQEDGAMRVAQPSCAWRWG